MPDHAAWQAIAPKDRYTSTAARISSPADRLQLYGGIADSWHMDDVDMLMEETQDAALLLEQKLT